MHLLSQLGQATDYSQEYSDAEIAAAAAAVTTGLLFAFLLLIVFYVVYAVALGKIFKKAGVESWKAWVPIYNNWTLLELGDQKGYWAIVSIIPLVGIVGAIFMYMAMYEIGLKFGKDGTFVLLAIFFPFIWLIWLAVDSSTWKAAAVHASKAPAYQPPTATKQ